VELMLRNDGGVGQKGGMRLKYAAKRLNKVIRLNSFHELCLPKMGENVKAP